MASDYRASGVPVIFVRDIQSGRFDWKSSVYISRRKALELDAHRADPGDVLITKMGDPPGVATVHPAGFPSGVITADVIRIRPREQLAIPEWLALYINSSHVTRQVRKLAAGVTRQKLTLGDFRGVKVLLPPVQEQLSTVKHVAAVDRLLSSEEGELTKLKAAKDGLLGSLLRGRLRVSTERAS
jgi:type I restriction enzyme S subunit